MQDDATRVERRWLDRLEKVRPDMGKLYVTGRDEKGDIRFLSKELKGRGYCYLVTTEWIKKEVRTLEKQLREEREQECRNCVGAFI